MAIGSEWYQTPKGMNGPAGPTNINGGYVPVSENEDMLGYFIDYVDGGTAETHIDIDNLISLACPVCESPIEAFLEYKTHRVVNDIYNYKVTHKICDCPYIAFT